MNENKKEFVFLPTECRIQPLGMENGEIPNEAVKASSYFRSRTIPWQARLNNMETIGYTGAWCTLQNAIGEYLQIDLGKKRVVNKIATQGRPWTTDIQWVTSYKLLFSSDEANWNEYQNKGVVKVNAVKETRSLAAWVTILNSKTWSISTGGNHIFFMARGVDQAKIEYVKGSGVA